MSRACLISAMLAPAGLLVVAVRWLLSGLGSRTWAQLALGVAAALGCLLPTPTQAVRATFRSDPDYLIDTWQTEDGLPENSATAMVQTPDGYLWFGTWRGLVRFDGVTFKVFNPANTPQLPSDGIVNLHLDHRGRLWLSTLKGLVVRDGAHWTALGPREGWVGDVVRTFSERPNHDLLLTTYDGHIMEFVAGQLRELSPPPGERGRGYTGAADSSGAWWVTQNHVVCRWQGQQWARPVPFDQSMDRAEASYFSSSARDGGVWILLGNELLKFRGGEEVSRLPLPELSGVIWSLFEDSSTNVWVATANFGLLRVDLGGSRRRWTTANGLQHMGCRFVFEDQECNLWVGTTGGGLSRFKPRRFQEMSGATLLASRQVKSLSPASHGGMWLIASEKGLFRHDPSGVSPVPVPGASPDGLSVFEDRAGRVWYADKHACWWRPGPAGFEKLPLAPSADESFSAFFEDSKRRIWISGLQGLVRYDGIGFHQFGADSGLPPGNVASVGEDLAGLPWIAADGGVFRFQGDRFREILTLDAMSLRGVLCFMADPDGAMWMGTRSEGLLRWRDGRLSVIGPSAGFPVQTVQAILEDALGFFWMTSDRGIVRASRQELRAVADGTRDRLDCQLLDHLDGLPSAECSTTQPACARDPSGRLWFATQRGVATIDPASFRLNSRPPPVRIERLDYHALSAASNPPEHGSSRSPALPLVHLAAPLPEPLRLPPGSYGIEIEYTALSFCNPEKLRFQTRLEAIGRDWQDASGPRVARFPQLPPGDYLFRVRAANDDGIWNEAGARLAFTVLPFFWQTLWFKALCGATFAAFLYAAVRGRLARLERERLAQHAFARQLILSQENERKRISSELHDGLGQNLLLIKNRLAMATSRQAEPAELARQLDAAAAATARAITEVRSISHALRPAALEQVGLTKALAWMVEQLQAGVTPRLSAELDNIDGLLAPEMEMNLFRIIQEGLNNVLRHASAFQVILEVKREPAALRVSLFDDGRGFDAAKLRRETDTPPGLGLASIEERVRFLRGSLDLQSAPGRGTRLTVLVPLPTGKS